MVFECEQHGTWKMDQKMLLIASVIVAVCVKKKRECV